MLVGHGHGNFQWVYIWMSGPIFTPVSGSQVHKVLLTLYIIVCKIKMFSIVHICIKTHYSLYSSIVYIDSYTLILCATVGYKYIAIGRIRCATHKSLS